MVDTAALRPWAGTMPSTRRGSELGAPGVPGRVARLDRGWSTVLGDADPTVADRVRRVRNIGADVAVGDWVVPSDDGERVDHVLPRRSAFVRRASFEGARAESDTLAANIDVVFITHSFGNAPNQRRLERELVLAFDSGAEPVVVLTKADLVDDPEPSRRELVEVAFGVPVLVTSGHSGAGIEAVRAFAAGGRTLAFLGASGVGKSTLVNALLGQEVQATTEVRTRPARSSHHGRRRAARAPDRRLADRHAGRPGTEPVALGRGHRAGLCRRLRADGALPVPRLQARP